MTREKPSFIVVKASRYFKVRPFNDAAKNACYAFQRRYLYKLYKDKNDHTTPDQYIHFAIALQDGSEYRFHKNAYNNFLDHLKTYAMSTADFRVIDKTLPSTNKIKFRLKKGRVPRDYQLPIIEYLKAPLPKTKFIGIQPGEGKTFTSLCGVVEHGYRTIVILNAGLMKQWAEAIYENLDIPKNRTMSITGSKQLKGAIELAKTKAWNSIDLVLMSNTTYQNWISEYESLATEKFRDLGYGIDPEDFYEHMGIGHRIIDETHMKFHLNFKQDLYTNTHVCTSLSATLFSYDKEMESYYLLAYPMKERYNGGEVKKYTKSFAIMWFPHVKRKYKTTERNRNTYSHNAFEKSILKDSSFAQNYAELIAETLELGYFKNYKEGNKAAVYVSSIEMATFITKYLSQRFPDKSCKRYVSLDPIENLHEPDLRVTTLGSAGTGHDVRGLTDTILTVGIMSLQSNIQVFGRTRFIPDQDTRFYYFNCLDIEKHMRYHQLKVELMEKRAKSFGIIRYNTPV